MVEELEQAEKEARKARRITRMLYILIGIDLLLFGYAIFEVVSLIILLAK